MRKMNYSMVTNLYRVDTLPGALKMGLLFLMLGAKERIGHDCKGFGFFLTKKLPVEIFRGRHVCDAMKDIAIEAGGISDDHGVQISWNRESEVNWGHLFSKDPAGCRHIVALNPGGDRQNRRWSPDHYALLADRLISDFNARAILLGGPGEENIALAIANRMINQPINVAGQLGLSDLVYIISRVDLLITNDSGPMHIGAAVGTPLVAIFGPEDPSIHGPCTKRESYRIVIKDVDCRPCKKSVCREMICLEMIHPHDVYEKCKEFFDIRKSSRKEALTVDGKQA
jgi:ADP-heptose:LPS heptosyltransferase